MGHNEWLIAKALEGRDREALVVATKGGHTRPGGAREIDGSPDHLREACEASLRALETDCIPLYQLHRPDPDVPYAESVGALKDLRDEGKIRAGRPVQLHRGPARRGARDRGDRGGAEPAVAERAAAR